LHELGTVKFDKKLYISNKTIAVHINRIITVKHKLRPK